MNVLVAAAVLAAVMAAAAVWLVLAVSPWVLLAWPGAAVLFAVFVAAEVRWHRAQPDAVPPCTGCASPLCPDCHADGRHQ